MSKYALHSIILGVLTLAGVVAIAARPANTAALKAAHATPMTPEAAIANDAIDMEGFLRVANAAAGHRESRRLTEEEFLRMSREPGTLILDARSRDMYDLMHVEGAINLPFPDISIASLETMLPDKSARILIYCNNNFENEERAFPSKMPTASLNLSTYTALYNYGYRNVYELGPRRDPKNSLLTLVTRPPADDLLKGR